MTRDPITGRGVTLPVDRQFQEAANNLREFYENDATDAQISGGCMTQYHNREGTLPALPVGHIYYEG